MGKGWCWAPAPMGCVWKQWPSPPSPGMLSSFFFFSSGTLFLLFSSLLSARGLCQGSPRLWLTPCSISKAQRWHFASRLGSISGNPKAFTISLNASQGQASVFIGELSVSPSSFNSATLTPAEFTRPALGHQSLSNYIDESSYAPRARSLLRVSLA